MLDLRYAFFALVLAVGCSPDDEALVIELEDTRRPDASRETDSGNGAPDTAIMADTAGDLGTAPDLGVVPPTDIGLNIAFDHRFDRAGFFASPEARAVLSEAARQWGIWLRDDFETIVAGTVVYTRDPEDPSLEEFFDIEADIDDVLVFVGSANRDGSLAGSSATAGFPSATDEPELRARLKERWDSADDFEPWTAWMSFDNDQNWFFDATPQTSDDIPAGTSDALSVTLHELGHILGISPGAAFAAHVVDGAFHGPNAMAVYGGPVPLADGFGHIAAGVTIDGKVPVMSTEKPSGVRYELTRLDLAMLADVGYELP